MGLKAGTFLGQYEILSLLGVGGMGKVYRARDSKLNREVALKVLPEQFVRDPERIGRFRREAQVLAALDHPNIARIYAFEETGSARFLVMELAEGETLKERIKRGNREWGVGSGEEQTGTSPRHTNRAVATPTPRQAGMPVLPVEEAVGIAGQIAEGLEHAHEKGVVHRDLKPANVKVTPEGVVKVLDFGLAKAFAGDTASSDPSDSPTLSAMTQPGTVLGTAAYMSPEQARGRRVDKRTDIWALGCVLYEMLAGKHAFDGEDVPEILASVMKGEPDWEALPETTPPGIRRLLRRCLQKDAARRFHSAADMAIVMDEALQEPEAAAPAANTFVPAPGVERRPVWRRAMSLIAAALVLGAIIAGFAVWKLKPEPPRPVSRVVVPLPADQRLGLATDAVPFALSPDGTHLAYIASANGGPQQIFLRSMDSLDARPIAGTDGAFDPFFSPDGQWVGFFAERKLKKVSVNGGASLALADVQNDRGGTWGPNDVIVFSPDTTSELFHVPAAGGTPQKLTTFAGTESTHRHPQFLPDGNSVLFLSAGGTGTTLNSGDIAVVRMDTGERRVLIRGGLSPRYIPTGHLVYNQAGTLMAVPFDPVRVEVLGTPTPVIQDVGVFSFSNNGSLAYLAGGSGSRGREMVWVDRMGEGKQPESRSFAPAQDDKRKTSAGPSSETTSICRFVLRMTSERPLGMTV